MSINLTDAEREALLTSFLEPDDDCVHNAVPLYAVVESIVAARLEQQREALAAAIEDAPSGDRIARMYFAEGIRAAARIVREYQPGEDT